MGFSLFGSSGDNKTSTTTETTVTDASATAAEGSLAASGQGQISINSVDSKVTGQAFGFGETALASNTQVAEKALDTGVESLRISSNLVPDLLASQNERNKDVLKAAQENVNLAEQFASSGAALARGASTGGATSLIDAAKPLAIVAALALVAVAYLKKKS